MKQLRFSARGKNFTVDTGDAFMDNGSTVIFIPKDDRKIPVAQSIMPPKHEWERLKPQLEQTTYEAFYGRKPKMTGIIMYVYK